MSATERAVQRDTRLARSKSEGNFIANANFSAGQFAMQCVRRKAGICLSIG